MYLIGDIVLVEVYGGLFRRSCTSFFFIILFSFVRLGGFIPIITCNWGPWGEVGMAKVGSKPYNSGM